MRHPAARILVFAKAPVAGAVKTRLVPALGAEGAARLHARLVRRTVAQVDACGLAPLELHVAPDGDHPLFRSFAAAGGTVVVQHGRDLGERMHAALAAALTAAEFAILIGTDCPALDCAYLALACDALAQGRPAVLGPAEDGGYVLIGLRRAAPTLFTGVDWGGPQVLVQTRRRLAELAWEAAELPTLWDLDRPADLQRLGAAERAALCGDETSAESWPAF